MRLFNKTFCIENNKISRTTVVRIIQHFKESDSTRNRPKSDKPATTANENKALDVLQCTVT